MKSRSVAALGLCVALLLGTVPSAASDLVEEPDAPPPKVRRSHVSSQLSAAVNAREAERRLAEAQRKRSRGRAALPGEIVQTPDGAVVGRNYWHRQEKLRREVEVAQQRVNRVQRRQLANR